MGKRLVGFLTAALLVCGVVAPAWAVEFPDYVLRVSDLPDAQILSEVLGYKYILAMGNTGPKNQNVKLFVSTEPFVIDTDTAAIRGGAYDLVNWSYTDSSGELVNTCKWDTFFSKDKLAFDCAYYHYILTNFDTDITSFKTRNSTVDVYANAISGGGSGGDPSSGDPWIDGGAEQVKILSPRDGFQQQGVKVVKTRVYFCVPYDGDKSKLKYGVKGFDPSKSKAVSLDLNVIENGKKIEGILTVEGIVKQWNIEQSYYAEITDYTGKVWTSPTNRVTCYEDFVDEDGDGLDDRTGQDEWTGGSGDPTDPRPGGDITAGFDNIGDMLKSFTGSLTGLIDFIQEFFSFLPAPVFVVLAAGIALIVLLRIFGR